MSTAVDNLDLSALSLSTPKDTYVLCADEGSVSHAVSVLASADYVLLDCEGQNLGSKHGKLSLLNIGTPHADEVFVFDGVVLNKEVPYIRHLVELLENERPYKVMWDGRMDYVEILLHFGVRLKGVIDLQIAEVVSRAVVRGEGDDQRLRRIATAYLGLGTTQALRSQLDGIHVVIGMQKCLEEVGLANEFKKDPAIQRMHKSGQSYKWMQRPLSADLIAYAVQDIHLLGHLYDYFVTNDWISGKLLEERVAQSDRYVSLFNSHEEVIAWEANRAFIVVPMEVLTAPVGRLYPCHVCGRSLSFSCFQTNTRGQTCCRLCYVIARKLAVSVADLQAHRSKLLAGLRA